MESFIAASFCQDGFVTERKWQTMAFFYFHYSLLSRVCCLRTVYKY